MDPVLREMCVSVINGEVNGERFTNLLMESGMNLEEIEWQMVTRLLGESDRINYIAGNHTSPAFYQ